MSIRLDLRAAALAMIMAAACGGPQRGAGAPLSMTLSALDGGELNLARFRGKVVVLHLFTTWALAAHADVLQLDRLVDREDVVVIGVALDPEGFKLVSPWRTGSRVRYRVALGDDAMRAGSSPLGKIELVPTTVVLDGEGRVAARVEGELAEGQLAKLVDAAR